MALYPNTSTKQIINTEIKKKINTLDSKIENVNDIAEQAQSTANNALNSVSDLSTVVDDKQTQIDAINETLDTVQSTLSEKQDTLTFDNEPLLNSDNPVKSSGIYTELEKKLDKDNVKFDPEPNGTDALSTGGAYDIVQDLAEQIHNVQNGVVLQSTDETQFVNNGGIIIDNTQEEVTNAIEVRNGDTKLKDTDVDGDLTSTTLAVENDATIGGNATVDGNVTSNEFIGGLEKSISITDENNTTHTFNNTDNVSLSGVLKAQKDINGDSIDSTYVKNATKGVANGIATLDENGRLPYSQLPESAMELKGLWDASTNTPTLVQGVGTNGDFYIVSVGGTQFGETFNVNDRIVFVSDDNTWHRLPYTITSPVTSVNDKIGAVTLYGTDIQKSNSDSETITHALDNISNKISDAIGSLNASSVGGSGKYISEISETNGVITATSEDIDTEVTSGSSKPVTSGVMYKQKFWYDDGTGLSAAGWYKIATFGRRSHGCAIQLKLASTYYNTVSCSHNIKLNYGWLTANCLDFASDDGNIFSKIKICYNNNNNDEMALYVYYSKNNLNNCFYTIDTTTPSSDRNVTLFNFVTDSTVYDNEIEYNLGTDGLYVNGVKIN